MLHEEELAENRFMPGSILPPFLFLASLLKITAVIARTHCYDHAGGAAAHSATRQLQFASWKCNLKYENANTCPQN